jgi:hypothetical protein
VLNQKKSPVYDTGLFYMSRPTREITAVTIDGMSSDLNAGLTLSFTSTSYITTNGGKICQPRARGRLNQLKSFVGRVDRILKKMPRKFFSTFN